MSPRTKHKKQWSRPLADLVGTVVDPVFARQGFSETDLILHWDDIVGPRLGASSRPIKLQWPPRPPNGTGDMPPQPATLVVRVEGGFAIELQHMADQVLARINAHLGWRCIGRMVFKQGPIDREDRSRRRAEGPSPESLASASAVVGGVEDAMLRNALTRLGARVLKSAR